MSAHLIAAPIVLPLAVGALMLPLDERRHALKATLSLAASAALVLLATALALRADAAVSHVYPLGGWPAPFGIVLVADRLGAAMRITAARTGAQRLPEKSPSRAGKAAARAVTRLSP